MSTVFSLFESSHQPLCCLMSKRLHVNIFLDSFFLFVCLFTPVYSCEACQPTHTTQDHATKRQLTICTYLIPFKCLTEQIIHKQCITTALSSYWHDGQVFTECTVQNVNIFMQDEPASSWSKYTNIFQVQVSFWYCFIVKGTIDVN